MGKLLRKLSKLLFQTLGRFVGIVIILMGIAWCKTEFGKLQVRKQEGFKFEKLLEDTNQYLQQAKEELGKHEVEWKRKKDAICEPIVIQIEAIDHELREKGPAIAEQVKKLSTAEGQAILLKDAVDAARNVVNQAQSQINKHDEIWLLGSWNPYSSARKAKLSAATLLLSTAEQAVALHDQIRTKLKSAISQSDVEILNQRRQEMEKELATATGSVLPEEIILLAELRRKEETVVSLRETLQTKREEIANDPMQRAVNFMKEWILTAIGILAGLMLIPPILKAVCYYGIAPFASRVKPICVLPTKDAPLLPETRESLVSMDFLIGPGDEMLVHSDFLQSSSTKANKRTQALLNPSIPFSSIASGMCLLRNR